VLPAASAVRAPPLPLSSTAAGLFNDEDIEEYMPNDDEVDDFGESPHSSPTQADGEENAMDDIDFRDI
jgi:hypothetical protein